MKTPTTRLREELRMAEADRQERLESRLQSLSNENSTLEGKLRDLEIRLRELLQFVAAKPGEESKLARLVRELGD